jgi:hypothetical protein
MGERKDEASNEGLGWAGCLLGGRPFRSDQMEKKSVKGGPPYTSA